MREEFKLSAAMSLGAVSAFASPILLAFNRYASIGLSLLAAVSAVYFVEKSAAFNP